RAVEGVLAPSLGERERRADEPDVREGLREVAERGAGRGVDLLRVEAHVVRVPEQPLEPAPRVLDLARAREALDRPEAREPEAPLARGQPVVEPLGSVALDEGIAAAEAPEDAGPGRAHARRA